MKATTFTNAAVATATILGLTTAHADERKHYKAESISPAKHHVFNTTDEVDGATILIRDYRRRLVTADISSRALEPDTAYSIWWAIFNNPRHCIMPNACSVRDLEVNGGSPRVKASVFWAGGFISDGEGIANISLRLNPGATTRELFAQSKPYGLRNLKRAEIHMVIRTHGPSGLAGPIAEQISSANMACPPAGCANVFASIHYPN